MEKLFFIPRAIFDIIEIWSFNLSFKQKSSFTYTLIFLKWNKWAKPKNSIINVPLKKYNLKVYNNNQVQFVFKEIYLQQVYKLPPQIKASKILDAGANIGLATLYFHDTNPQAIITAYEPCEKSFNLLKQNFRFIESNVHLNKIAVSNFNGSLFEESTDEFASVNQKFSFKAHGKPVDCIRLADVLEKDNYDVVKLDVEGAEENILKDCFEKNIIQKTHCWFIEFHNKSGINNWLEKFQQIGFRCRIKENVYCFVNNFYCGNT